MSLLDVPLAGPPLAHGQGISDLVCADQLLERNPAQLKLQLGRPVLLPRLEPAL